MAEQRELTGVRRSIAVVGGGLAGLAAGLSLARRGDRVELFERSRLLGGRATSFEIDGIEVDNGQHVFLACCTAFAEFARDVGMERALYVQDRFDALVLARDGTAGRLRAAPALPAPLHVLASFARYPHLDAAGKIRVARALTSALFARDYPGGAPRSFDDWLEATGQDAATRRAFWDPFFIPALNAPFDKVDASDALFVLDTAFLRSSQAARFGFSRVPLAHFAAAAAARLDAVHLSTAVTSVETTATGVRLTTLKGDAPREFDGAVLAVTPPALAKLLGDPAAYGVGDLDAFDPYPILDVHLWHDGGTAGFDFAAALDSPLQWIFEKEPGYLACSFSAADEYMRVPTAELEAFAWSEVCAFVPQLRRAGRIRSAVTRNPEATYLPRIGTARPGARTAVPQLTIAGAWTQTGWPDTMESAVRSGRTAAQALQPAAGALVSA